MLKSRRPFTYGRESHGRIVYVGHDPNKRKIAFVKDDNPDLERLFVPRPDGLSVGQRVYYRIERKTHGKRDIAADWSFMPLSDDLSLGKGDRSYRNTG